jgi:hypothetical protein
MVLTLASALPAALDSVAAALGLSKQKDKAGARLMRLMARLHSFWHHYHPSCRHHHHYAQAEEPHEHR